MAAELEKLRKQVKRLAEDIRGGPVPAHVRRRPRFPTEPERRLRPTFSGPDGLEEDQ